MVNKEEFEQFKLAKNNIFKQASEQPMIYRKKLSEGMKKIYLDRGEYCPFIQEYVKIKKLEEQFNKFGIKIYSDKRKFKSLYLILLQLSHCFHESCIKQKEENEYD